MAGFKWTDKTREAALMLAEGKTRETVAKELNVAERTIYRWLHDTNFAAEVDRLSLMIGISSRAERLRIAMRVVRQKIGETEIKSDKDILDWLKFSQSETDGIKLDLSRLAALGADDASVAD